VLVRRAAPAAPDGAHGVSGIGELRGGASSEAGTSREPADRFVVHAEAAVLLPCAAACWRRSERRPSCPSLPRISHCLPVE